MLMSFVNLTANALVGNYPRVTMLPMKAPLPEVNRRVDLTSSGEQGPTGSASPSANEDSEEREITKKPKVCTPQGFLAKDVTTSAPASTGRTPSKGFSPFDTLF